MILIHAYKPEWPVEFEAIRSSLQEILGPLALRIDHIGSTAVPGLAAKDVIDVQVTVADLAGEITRSMREAGYTFWSDMGHDHVPAGQDESPKLWAKLLFSQPMGSRRSNVHVRIEGNPNQRYALLFRDYLRAHPGAAQSVERVKRELALLHPDDPDAYYAVKDPAYDLVWNAAQDWARQSAWIP